MFGLIPKVVWSRSVETDDSNRIELHHNCLLLESAEDDPDLGRPRRVVIETGTGDKLDEKMRRIFGLDGRTVESALRDAGGDPASIDDVVVTHLHFDHAGGLTRRVRSGESPDWTAAEGQASGDEPRIRLTFPNARVHVQRREWDDALQNSSVMTRTYYRDHLLPLEVPLPRGGARLQLHEAPPPFPPGATPRRGERPQLALQRREVEILPGVFVFLVPGHTWGQQAVRFEDPSGQPVVFVPDCMPTRHHAGAAYSLAYDVEPYTSMLTRNWLLEEAERRQWLLVLDHEAEQPFQRAAADGSGWWKLHPQPGPDGP